MSIEKDFIQELYELCKKYKKNIEAKVETTDSKVHHYEVTITGAWEISKKHSAVEVYQVFNQECVMSINGDKEDIMIF